MSPALRQPCHIMWRPVNKNCLLKSAGPDIKQGLLSSEQLYLQHCCVLSRQQPKPQNHCIFYTIWKQTRCTLTRSTVTMSSEDCCSVPKNYFPSLSSLTSLPYELVNEFLLQTLKPYSFQSKSQTIPKRARQHRTSEILQTARLGGKLLSLPHTDGHTQKAYGGKTGQYQKEDYIQTTLLENVLLQLDSWIICNQTKKKMILSKRQSM